MIKVSAIKGESLHVFGTVADSLTVNQGHAVVESGAAVAQAIVAPAENQTASVTVVNGSAVKAVAVDGAATANAIVTVEENATVEDVTVQNESSVTIANNGTIENIEIAPNANADIECGENGKLENVLRYVTDADSLKAAIASGGKAVFADNVELTAGITVTKDLEIDLNGYTLTQNTDAYYSVNVNSGVTLDISNGKYIINVTGGNSSAYGLYVSGSLDLCGVELEVNLISTRSRNSQSLYIINTYGASSAVTLTDSDLVGAVTSKTNENCEVTVYGVSAYNVVTVNGGSINAGYGVYSLSSSQVTLTNVNIGYTACGIDMKNNGGNVTVNSGVTFSGELTNPAITFKPSRNNAQLNDGSSGYEWVLSGTISDCTSYDPVIEVYKSGEAIKYVYTDEYPEHTYGEYEYSEWWGYTRTCEICGSEDYINSIPAGDSEQYYYPVNDEYGLQNAALNATAYIKLESDIAITSTYFYELKDGCVLDLNGHTITVNSNVYFNLRGNNVTIKNGKISRPAGIAYSYGLKIDGGNVTVDGIEIDSGINVSGATATVKNCTITLNCAQAYYQVCAQSRSTVTVENCVMNRTVAGKANNYYWVESGSSMTVKGCTYNSTCDTTLYNQGGVAPTVIED